MMHRHSKLEGGLKDSISRHLFLQARLKVTRRSARRIALSAETRSVTSPIEDSMYPPPVRTDQRVHTDDMVKIPRSRMMAHKILKSHRLPLDFVATWQFQVNIVPFSFCKLTPSSSM